MEKIEIDLGYVIQGRDSKTGNSVSFSSSSNYWSDGGVSMDMTRGWNGVYKTAADAVEALETAQRTDKSSNKVTGVGVHRIKLTVFARPATEQDIATAHIQGEAFSALDKQTFKDMTSEQTRQFLSTAARAMLDLKAEFAPRAKGSSKYMGSITLMQDGKDVVAVKTGYGDNPLETLGIADTLSNAPESIVNRSGGELGRQFIDRAFANAEKAAQANGPAKILVGSVFAQTNGKAIPKAELAKLVKDEGRDAQNKADRYARIQRSLKP